MENLIEIKSIPMSIEMKIKNATLEIASGNAAVELSKGSDGYKMRVKPTKVNIDQYKTDYGSRIDQILKQNYADKGFRLAYDATANYAREGNMLLNIQLKDNILAELAAERFNTGEVGYDDRASSPEFDPAEISIRYELDKMNFDWRMNAPEVVFTPGDIEVIIKEYARVEIEYVGSPIYVPPSADPNYEPVDELA